MHTANTRQQTANFGQTVPPCSRKSVPPTEKLERGTVYVSEIVVFWLFLVHPNGQNEMKKPSIFTEYEGFVLQLASFVLDSLRYGRHVNHPMIINYLVLNFH